MCASDIKDSVGSLRAIRLFDSAKPKNAAMLQYLLAMQTTVLFDWARKLWSNAVEHVDFELQKFCFEKKKKKKI